jgi:hypothetical protein
MLLHPSFSPNAHSALWAGLQGEYRCPSRQPTLGRKCLNLKQKKCKFLYDEHNTLRVDYCSCVTYPMVSLLHPGHPIVGMPPIVTMEFRRANGYINDRFIDPAKVLQSSGRTEWR